MAEVPDINDEAKWKRRLLAFTAVRAAGLAIFLLGVAIMYSDLLRPGGWPQVGAIVAILGLIDSLLAPRLLKRKWDEADK